MEIDVFTLFPEAVDWFASQRHVVNALAAGHELHRINYRDHTPLSGRQVDDTPFGGGAGMVLRRGPIASVLDELLAQSPQERRAIVVPSPAGTPFSQEIAQRLAGLDRLILVCGHYEGIDERLGDLYPVEEYSLGDFVLTGGELPALAFMDATVRLVEGVVQPESRDAESFSGGLLDYP